VGQFEAPGGDRWGLLLEKGSPLTRCVNAALEDAALVRGAPAPAGSLDGRRRDFISLQKDVALVSILGPLEAFRVAQIEAWSNFEYTPLVAAALLCLCVTEPLARVVDRMQRRRA
jgi:hypothetical protein